MNESAGGHQNVELDGVRGTNLVLRFTLELGALASVSYWGATVSATAAIRTAFAIICPFVLGLVWGLFISPKARFPTGLYGRGVLGFVVFSSAASGLAQRGHLMLATVYWGLALMSSILFLAWRQ